MYVSVVGAKLWNEFDSTLRNTKTILLFKKNQMGCTTHVCITYTTPTVKRGCIRKEREKERLYQKTNLKEN